MRRFPFSSLRIAKRRDGWQQTTAFTNGKDSEDNADRIPSPGNVEFLETNITHYEILQRYRKRWRKATAKLHAELLGGTSIVHLRKALESILTYSFSRAGIRVPKGLYCIYTAKIDHITLHDPSDAAPFMSPSDSTPLH